MTTSTVIIKYSIADTSGVVGQQPFKKKAKFQDLFGWTYSDKLNKLKEFIFTVPNDEFHRANAVVERKTFVPFIKPFRGFITKKSTDETGITLTAKEFAVHLERRIFTHDDEKRINVTTKDWFDGAWKYRRRLVINKEKVDGDITKFPLLLNVPSNTGFKNQAQSTGNDFVITSNDGLTKIPHEIEKYDSSTGELVVWIRTLDISSTSDVELFLYYGNDDVANQEDIINVWKGLIGVADATTTPVTFFAFEGVWHLHDNSLDSTENNNDGTDTSITRVAAQMADGASFDGSLSKIDVGQDNIIGNVFRSNGWVTAWFNPKSDGELNVGAILDKTGWIIRVQDEASGFVRVRFIQGFSTTNGQWETAVDIPLNELTRIDIVYDNDSTANDPDIYINGVVRTVALGTLTEIAGPPSGSDDGDNGSELIIGNNIGQTTTFDGEVDEVRTMDVPPANVSSFITSDYNNQNDNSNFLTVFPQEQYLMSAREISQQIIDSANLDQDAGVTWKLDDGFAGTVPTSFRIPVVNLLAYLPFEKSLIDHANNNDGSLGAGKSRFIDGQIGKAFNFDGFTWILLANQATFDFAETDDFTISFRIKTTDNNKGLVAKRVGSGGEGWSVRMLSTGIIQFLMEDGIAAIMSVDGTTVINDGEWHSITCSKKIINNSSGMSVFIDGVDESANRTGGSLAATSTTETVKIGIEGTGDSIVNSTTNMDEVRIYDKPLTLQDAKELSDLSTAIFAGSMNLSNHYEALQIVAEVIGKDVFFNNKDHIIFMETKGKTLDPNQKLDLIITSKPEISTDDFANEINLLGKGTKNKLQLEKNIKTDTVLRFNYEKVITDSQLTEDEQLQGVGDNLLKEFQKLTPQVRARIPYTQFIRLDLGSGDVIKITEPKKQISASFRVMEITANQSGAKLILESTDTGVVRLRSLSFTDTIEAILKRIQDQSIIT